MKYTCIYCKKEKEDEEFNREHVVPRMMGRYTDGFVLSDHQVCQECNSFFSREIEDKIGLDSYEALLRMRSGTKKMKNGHKVRNNRLSIIGAEGLFKGLRFTPISDSNSPERFSLEIEPCIGFRKNDEDYEFYSIDNIPQATEEVLSELKKYESPIIQFGYTREQADFALREKGYINDKSTYVEKEISKEYGESDFLTSIQFSIDSIVRRVCAKTIFNYLCWSNSAEFMLDSRFDALRRYIRYGEWDDSLWFRYSIGYVTVATPPNDTSHVVGTMLNFNNGVCELLGCVTWFGEITYILKICEIPPTSEHDLGGLKGLVMPTIDTKFTYFNNETSEITSEDAMFVYAGRND